MCWCTSRSHSQPFFPSCDYPANALRLYQPPKTLLLLALLRCRFGVLPLRQSQLLLEIQQFCHLGRHHILRCLLDFERSHLFSLQWAKMTKFNGFIFSCQNVFDFFFFFFFFTLPLIKRQLATGPQDIQLPWWNFKSQTGEQANFAACLPRWTRWALIFFSLFSP